jgi:outer membrane protein assembly factor BamA
VSFGVCDLVTIDALRTTQRLSPLAFSLSGDDMNDALSPTRGYTYLFTFEHASVATLSDFRYNRGSAEGTHYFPVGANGTIAAHIRGGWVGALASTAGAVGVPALDTARALLHPRKRFYAGGSRSVRGYGENQLGPRILTIDPAALMAEDLENPCTLETIASGDCDPSEVPSSEFEPRPLGGNTVLEASVEYRFGLFAKLRGAVFVDAASVGQTGINPFSGGFGAVTPGFGIRYDSPAGPVRIDLGLRPALAENLPVITQTIDADGNPRIVRLDMPKNYNPLEGASGIGQITRRLALHLSIGQAF